MAPPLSGTTPRRGWSIAVVLIGVFVSSLDLFIVNIAFPDLERAFPSAGLSDLSWVLSAYAITFAAFLAPAGRWADRAGRKRAYLAGLVLFTLASAACAAAPSLGALVAARTLQAVGGGLMLPSSLGLLLPLFPPHKRGAAVGLWSAMGGAAAALGPPVGGLLVQAGWQWVFLVNLPIGVAACAVGVWALREIRDESSTSPDVLGALVLAVTVGAVVAAIVQGESWGWTSGRVLGMFALGALGVVFSAVRAVRHPAPVIEPAILRIRAVALANVATVLFFAGFGAMILASVLFLTGLWHHSVLRSGLEIAPGPLMAAVCAVPGGLLATKYGNYVVGFAGSLLFAVGGVLWATATATDVAYVSAFLPAGLIAGAGAGLALPSLSGAATLPLPPERFATGTALVSMCRQVGLALGAAVVAAVLGARPDLGAFHTAYFFMAVCGLTGGLALLGIRDSASRRVPAPVAQGAAPR
ncbi:MFS transporter [Streptomyces longwoodensis]|uniref:MFS transporter n=1 Tax=Streptomyces longwoodensis TaxID=68231 RepID=UPI002E816439|nr:MFS transporter [Streptomyces longwoodensis]WTI43431.1 MFS transporter [Streptomyces longwoodensis]WUC56193.1 MFS transporter [Streptomyces longwoodensis]WUC69724.1 MFS transporter [Streptomyces longwoodensis]